MAGLTDPSVSSRGAYYSLNQGQGGMQESQDGQVFPLQDKSNHSQDHHHSNEDFRVSIANDNEHDHRNSEDEDDEDDEELEALGDIAPLASSKRYHFRSGSASRSSSSPLSRVSNPCRILGAVFGIAVAISLAFALMSTLNQPDHRVLIPPPGVSADNFNISDFQTPPWDWDINSYLPIDITNGPIFAHVVRKDGGEQYLAVDCPHQANYRYHFPSFPKNEFRDYPTDVDDLLPLGGEPYVFVLCPPGINNANVIFREFDEPSGLPTEPPHVDGTMEAPQPLLDDVILILVDAISRAKFTVAMKTVMEVFASINSTAGTGGDTGYRVFDFKHYNVLGQNSPPNKAVIYSGQLIRNMQTGPKHWLWDVYEEQGFKTAHTDGECGGEQDIHDYTSGAITYEYSYVNNRIPAQYQMPQTAWCQNHLMHTVRNTWGHSCTLPKGMNYDATQMGGMRWNTPYCAGEKAIYEHIMENLEGWLSSTKGQRRFATYSFLDTHTPDHHHISFDRKLGALVQRLLVGYDNQPPLLSPNSALVVMADHGLHYGQEMYNFQGFIHHKIPPLFIALPNQFLNSHPDFLVALEQNQNRILSHSDLHQTFIHLAYGDMPVEGESASEYSDFMIKLIADGTFRQQFHAGASNGTSYAQVYGRSLLLPIDENRTCRTAGIPHDFCAFQPFLNLDPTKALDAAFMRGALALLANRMNELIRSHHVDDVCHSTSSVLQPAMKDGISLVNATFEDIGTADLVMESAYASSIPSQIPTQHQSPNDQDVDGDEKRVFYFMVRDRRRLDRKYSVTMLEDEVAMGRTDGITIIQMSAYAAEWSPCASEIQARGKTVGRGREILKHFCVCCEQYPDGCR